MRSPPAHDAALPSGWLGRPGRRATAARRRLPLRSKLARNGLLTLAAAVMAVVVAFASYVALRSTAAPDAGSSLAASGTASLGSATCADWRRDGVARRLAIVQLLEVAATKPDPENRGATLERGQAYGLFQRVCSTPESRSALLYEAYNRAASFRYAAAGSGVFSSTSGGP